MIGRAAFFCSNLIFAEIFVSNEEKVLYLQHQSIEERRSSIITAQRIITTATFEFNNREYTIEKSISGDYCRLLYNDILLIGDSACEDYYGEPSELIEIFKADIMEEASKRMPWWILIGAMFEWGSDPELIEDEDNARRVSDIIEGAEIYMQVTDREEIDEQKAKLDLDDNDVSRIFTFVNANAGSFCLAEDY